MSGAFSADWLALREPADHAARDPGLVASLCEALGDRPVSIVDLGCGTGSNLRALAPHLPEGQSWRLIDHDPALLARARETLANWAEDAEERDGSLMLRRDGRRIAVSFRAHDLATDLDAALGSAPDLVTAAALFDLLSPAAIERVAEAVTARGAAFYTALTYDGREKWYPPHPADGAILAAFLADLGRDKGFGPSAGHRANQVLEAAFAERGYRVRIATSPWRLGEADAALRTALAEGIAGAVSGPMPAPDVASWLTLRRQRGTATIGHQDLLALPG